MPFYQIEAQHWKYFNFNILVSLTDAADQQHCDKSILK